MTAATDTSAFSGDASEVSQSIATFIRNHDGVLDEAARDLARLLAHDLASSSSARLRLGHLRLVIDMLGGEGRERTFLTGGEYQAEVVRRATRGEVHPDESALRSAYGHWLTVIEAATSFLFGGGGARVMHSHRYAHGHQGYDVQEILSAFLRCRGDLADWPTEWEFFEWATLRRRLARENPRVPGPKQVRKAFGSYADALDVAKGYWDQGAGGGEAATPAPSLTPDSAPAAVASPPPR